MCDGIRWKVRFEVRSIEKLLGCEFRLKSDHMQATKREGNQRGVSLLRILRTWVLSYTQKAKVGVSSSSVLTFWSLTTFRGSYVAKSRFGANVSEWSEVLLLMYMMCALTFAYFF